MKLAVSILWVENSHWTESLKTSLPVSSFLTERGQWPGLYPALSVHLLYSREQDVAE